MMTNLGFNLGRKTLLGWCTRRVVNSCIGKKRSSKRGLDIRTQEAQVVSAKTWPDTGAELLSLSQVGDVSSRSVLKRTAGSSPSWATPMLTMRQSSSEKGTANKPPKRMANVLVSLAQAIGVERWRYRPARVEHLGPSAARAEKREGPLCVRVTTNSIQEIASFGNTALQQGLTPRP